MKKLILELLCSFGYLFLGSMIELCVTTIFPLENFVLEMIFSSLGFAISFSWLYFLTNRKYRLEINPIFTFSLWLRNQISFRQLFITILFQLLGAVLAGGLLYVLFSDISSLVLGYGTHSIFYASLNTILLIEMLFSFVLVFCFLILIDSNIHYKKRSVLLGIILFILLFLSIPYTGGVVNPLHSISINLFVNSDSLRQSWIYALSNLAGSLLAVTFYCFYSFLNHKVTLQHFS